MGRPMLQRSCMVGRQGWLMEQLVIERLFPAKGGGVRGRSQIWWTVRVLCGDSEDVAQVLWGARMKHLSVAPHLVLAHSFSVSHSKNYSLLIPLLSFLNQCNIS
ncbi:hypothetical protein AMTRI_Chr11g98120 [Amborella trichopoda]